MIFTIKKYQSILVLGLILAVGFFLREYQAVSRFGFAHDADLFSWIVKDIALNHHLRLIGQETSAPGIFIGPLFYYLLIPFFWMTHFDPAGALIFSGLIGLLTILSFYFVFKKIFDQITGQVAAFIQSVLLLRVDHDRWVVPTITDNLWLVWYFYSIISLARGQFNVLWLLGLLIGLIWHINFSLAILLILVPMALLLSKKLPKVKHLFQFSLGFLIPSVPLILFEIRHGFQQTRGFINSFLPTQGGEKGLYRISRVIDQSTRDVSNIFYYPSFRDTHLNVVLSLSLLVLGTYLILVKLRNKKLLVLSLTWILAVLIFFTLSSKILSEYYFSSVYMMILMFLIVIVSYLIKSGNLIRKIVVLILILLALNNIIQTVVSTNYNGEGYLERKAVAQYITTDSRLKNFPCVSVSYITTPGEGVGFRYFFYLDNLHVNQSSSGSPDYTIVIPYDLAINSVKIRYGLVGVIPPTQIPNNYSIIKSCQGENANLTDPFFGFTQ